MPLRTRSRRPSGTSRAQAAPQIRSERSPFKPRRTRPRQSQGYTAPYLALTANAILVANAFELAVALPLSGGALASLALPSVSPELASEAQLSGLDIQGAYWAIPGLGNDPGSVVLSPADGGPVRVLWAAQPFSSGAREISADGAGGWILVGDQIFDDQIDHMTVRALDAAGASTLLGCSPGSIDNSFVELPFAVAPDAVYVVAMNL